MASREASRMNDLETERALLGAALSGYPQFDDLAQIVFPVDFDSIHHEAIWSACMAVSEAGNRVEPVAVRVAMGKSCNQLPGGPVYLADLMREATIVSAATTYAKEVATNAARRRIAHAATRLHALSESALPMAEVSEQARATVDEAIETRAKTRLMRPGDLLPRVLDIAQHGREQGLSSGWSDIDRFTQGLRPGRLIIVGSRPGVGKSIMGTNLALTVAHKHKRDVLLCSMEMDSEEVLQRIISAHLSVNLTRLETGDVQPNSWDRIAERHQEVIDMPIHIADEASQALAAIRSRIRDLQRSGESPALVVVDYLQLMQVRDPRLNRAESIGELSRGLKIIAREFNTCVVAMAQLNRESAGRHDGKPRLSDLRESGSIEADADIVLLLHRVKDGESDIDVLVEKNRSGPRGVVNLELHGVYARLEQKHWSPAGAIA